eukprot:1183229-Rhodomonas_salina.3
MPVATHSVRGTANCAYACYRCRCALPDSAAGVGGFRMPDALARQHLNLPSTAQLATSAAHHHLRACTDLILSPVFSSLESRVLPHEHHLLEIPCDDNLMVENACD